MSIADRLTTEPIAIPRPAATSLFTRIDTFDEALTAPGGFGARLRECRSAALDFRRVFAATGTPDSVRLWQLLKSSIHQYLCSTYRAIRARNSGSM
ncbi:hypothetical protein ACIA8C_01025 [Nocardia sp. NPDC051321]|uniref:hypothetical protein n=1 Tax=Nocardia sp. NPDC051321 TaxID=3364323 RepID=UPI0037B8C01C